MKRSTKNFFLLLCLLCLLILIFFNSQEAKQNIIIAAELFLTQVFPSLFPMFLLSELLTAYHFPEYLANTIGKGFSKIFHTTPYGIFAFFMSLISGTPSSAFILKNLLMQNKITQEEASFLLSFTFFSNPLFLLNMLTLLFPNNPRTILKIILFHYTSNIIIGFLLRPKNKTTFQKIKIIEHPKDIGTNLSKAIKKSLDTLLLILGTICFYYMLANLIPIENEFIKTLLKGFLELTQGLNALRNPIISINIKEILAIAFISFGGISIHTQIKSIISDTPIAYKPFLKGRILHVVFSILFIIIF